MNKIEIKNRFNGDVIYSYECKDNTLKITCVKAVLDKISLRGANLRDANLYGADLYGANLSDANLSGADLSGAAIVIYGMMWTIQITKNHIKIGCQSHTLDDWAYFDDDKISKMHDNALEFWKENKDFIINKCKELSK